MDIFLGHIQTCYIVEALLLANIMHHHPAMRTIGLWSFALTGYLVGYSIPKPNLWELISLFLCDLPLQKHEGWEKSTKDPLRNNWINAFTTVGHTPANHIKELLPITGQSEIDMSLILEHYILAFRGARHCLKTKSKFHALSKQQVKPRFTTTSRVIIFQLKPYLIKFLML